jgi:glycosyltransferase involved in cell wall biosynthesis
MKLPSMKLPFARPDRSPQPVVGSLWGRYGADALALAEAVDLDICDLDALRAKAPPFVLSPGRGSCNWYLQEVGAVTVGGLMTAFRIADQLKSTKGVHQRFLICGRADLQDIARRVLAAFPNLRGSEFLALDTPEKLAAIPAADIGVATLWTTAYVLARVTNCARKMYLIQDFEPLFYPAGSTSAQAELTYRFGFDGICNTEPLRALYQDRYKGEAVAFTPQLDRQVFHPGPTERRWPRARVFFYARPENPRNAFELSVVALKRLKHRLGSSVEILCAGAQFDPKAFGLDGVVEPLGWLPYEQTGELYRTCHVGLSSMLTPHPSYLPFELMACGALVVALRNEANAWLLEDGVTCLCAEATASDLADKLFKAVTAWDELGGIRANAARTVSSLAGRGWSAELADVVAFMTRPAAAAETSQRRPEGSRRRVAKAGGAKGPRLALDLPKRT